MPKVVTSGAVMTCNFGLAPSTLTVLPIMRPTSGGQPVATIADTVPMVNVPPFGNCTSMSYPPTAAATAAALGALTPMPCVPVIPAPWIPGARVLTINQQPALLDNCKAMCAFGGQISISYAGQFFTDAT